VLAYLLSSLLFSFVAVQQQARMEAQTRKKKNCDPQARA